MKKSDEQLLAAIAEKDQEAIAELYERYKRVLYGALLRILRDTDDAEDILQDVFVQIWHKASSYKPELGAPKNWLVRIAHNRAINLVRSKRAQMKQSETALLEENSGLVAPELMASDLFAETSAAEQSQILASALEGLPKEQSVLLDLSFIQGYTHPEISEMLKLPLGTVKTRIRNGLLALRKSHGFLRGELTS